MDGNEKLRAVETIPGMGIMGIREGDRVVNSVAIYCKKFCKCHNVPPVQQ
jgi:hypothetical protein